MKIVYLINQYPKVSHSFIRREIIALENLGVDLGRYTIRAVSLEGLADIEDREEYRKTCILLNNSPFTFVLSALVTCMASPLIFFRALYKSTVLGWQSRQGVVRYWAYLSEACLLKIKLCKEDISHAHAHFGTNAAAVAMFCRILGGPGYSFTVHGPEEFDSPLGLALEEKIKHCRFVVTVSHFGRGQLMRWCPQDLWKKIKVVHCVVDDFFLQANQIAMPDSPRLVCVGRLCAQKGQLLLLEALHELDKKGMDFEMVLAGDGEMRGVVEQQIREYSLERKVRITGWISGAQVKEEILAAKVMVLPSFAEGLPVVIMESLALRRPVISTYVAGIPELVHHGKNGWLVPAGSVQDLVAALREALVASPEQLMQMGAAGAQAVRERHNSSIEAAKLLAYFKNECA